MRLIQIPTLALSAKDTLLTTIHKILRRLFPAANYESNLLRNTPDLNCTSGNKYSTCFILHRYDLPKVLLHR